MTAAARSECPEYRALAASTLALVLALAGGALFLPPWVRYTVEMPVRAIAVALMLACAMLLHWVFLGLAARRMRRSALGWVSLSVLLFPVGSATALILLGWLADEQHEPSAAM